MTRCTLPSSQEAAQEAAGGQETAAKVEGLVMAYNDIQDRLYEIDKSWKNNLIFYGIPVESGLEDEDPWATEEKVGILIFTIR